MSASKERWHKFELRPRDFAVAATTTDIHLFALGDGEIIEKVKIQHSEPFRGGALTGYTISVGVPGDLTKYAAAFDVFQEVLPRNKQLTNVLGGLEENAQASIRAAVTATGANLNIATQGVVEIAIKTTQP